MDPSTLFGVIGFVMNIAVGVVHAEQRAQAMELRQQVEQKVIAYRLSKGSARRLMRAEIQQMDLPEKAKPAQRALVDAQTRWQISISAALVEHELTGD